MRKLLSDTDWDRSSEPTAIRYSLVIPLRDEEGNVEALWEEVTAVMEGLGEPYELILVDDGSTDGTYERLVRLFERDARVQVLRLSRNFGQTAALAAGFDFARGGDHHRYGWGFAIRSARHSASGAKARRGVRSRERMA